MHTFNHKKTKIVTLSKDYKGHLPPKSLFVYLKFMNDLVFSLTLPAVNVNAMEFIHLNVHPYT